MLKSLLLSFFLLIVTILNAAPSPYVNTEFQAYKVENGVTTLSLGEPTPGIHGHFNNADLGIFPFDNSSSYALNVRLRLKGTNPSHRIQSATIHYRIHENATWTSSPLTLSPSNNDISDLFGTIGLNLNAPVGQHIFEMYFTYIVLNTITDVRTTHEFDNNGLNFFANYKVTASPSQYVNAEFQAYKVENGVTTLSLGEPTPGIHGHFNNADLGVFPFDNASSILSIRLRLEGTNPFHRIQSATIHYRIHENATWTSSPLTLSPNGNDISVLYATKALALNAPIGQHIFEMYFTYIVLNTNTDVRTTHVFDNNGSNFFANYTIEERSLPIVLVDFKVSFENDLVKLNWITASEKNNKEFQIERSFDAISFEKIGTVKGNGNSSYQQLYYFSDPEQYEGVAYYRLKQIDFDNKFSYSAIRKVNINNIRFQIAPNPVQSTLTLKGHREGSTIEILDVKGTRQLKLNVPTNKVDVSSLKPGTYFIKISSGNEFILRKFIKL